MPDYPVGNGLVLEVLGQTICVDLTHLDLTIDHRLVKCYRVLILLPDGLKVVLGYDSADSHDRDEHGDQFSDVVLLRGFSTICTTTAKLVLPAEASET